MSLKRSRKGFPRTRLMKHDTSKTLSNPDLVFRTLLECLQEGDADAAREVLAASLRHLNKTRLQRRYSIPRRTAYNLMTRKGSPSLALVAKVCRAIRAEHATP